VLLVWHQLAVRAYRGNDVVVFARGPWPVIIALILIEGICALDILLAPGDDIRIWLFLGYFLFGIGYLSFLPSALLFWVADTGRGMTPEDLKRIFERFWQASARTGRLGAGLGLPITKGIVEAHGGHIWAESTPGQGSRFIFAIPEAPLLDSRSVDVLH